MGITRCEFQRGFFTPPAHEAVAQAATLGAQEDVHKANRSSNVGMCLPDQLRLQLCWINLAQEQSDHRGVNKWLMSTQIFFHVPSCRKLNISVLVSELDNALMKLNTLKFRPFLLKHRK